MPSQMSAKRNDRFYVFLPLPVGRRVPMTSSDETSRLAEARKIADAYDVALRGVLIQRETGPVSRPTSVVIVHRFTEDMHAARVRQTEDGVRTFPALIEDVAARLSPAGVRDLAELLARAFRHDGVPMDVAPWITKNREE